MNNLLIQQGNFKDYGLIEPEITEKSGGFEVVVYDKKVGEKVGEKLSENQKQIIQFLKENKFISIKDLSINVGIAEKNIENNLAKLKEKGLLRRVGADKGGYWEIIGGLN